MNKKLIHVISFLILGYTLGSSPFAFGADALPPTDFNIPVYLATDPEPKDGKIFELKITGTQYQAPQKTTQDSQSLEGNTINTTFQGYAGSSLELAPGTQFQIFMGGNPVTLEQPITKVQNSGTRTINIPGTNYSAVLAFRYVPGGIFANPYFVTGIKKILNNNVKDEAIPADFTIPVYVAKSEAKDGKNFEIRLTGNRSIAPDTTRMIESFDGKSFNLSFQGYANSSRDLASGTQLQVLIDRTPVTSNKTIAPLQNSGTKEIEITNTPYTIVVAYQYASPFLGTAYYALGIKDIIINPEIKDFQERIPLLSREASDLLQTIKTDLVDKIVQVPLPNEDIAREKDLLTQKITSLKNTLTTIVNDNNKFPTLSEEGKLYLTESQKALNEAPRTITELKRELETLTNNANTAVAEAKAKTEAQQRDALKSRADSLFTSMNENALSLLRKDLEGSEPKLKQQNADKVNTLVNKVGELENTLKQLKDTLNIPNFDIEKTTEDLSKFESDFNTLNEDVSNYLNQHKAIIAERATPLQTRANDYTKKINEIDTTIAQITPPDAALKQRAFTINEKLQNLAREILGLETLPTYIRHFSEYLHSEGLIITDLNKIETDLPILEREANTKLAQIIAEKERIEAEEKAKAAERAKLEADKIQLGKDLTTLLHSTIPDNLEAPLNKETINPRAEEDLKTIRNEIAQLKNSLTSTLEKLNNNQSSNIDTEKGEFKTSQQKFDELRSTVADLISKNKSFNDYDQRIKTEQPAPADYLIPVYISSASPLVDGIKFELKTTGIRYRNTGTMIYEKESLGANNVDATFQGYANDNGILATDTQLQIFMDGKPVATNKPISPLRNSGSDTFEITGTPYTVTVDFSYVSGGFFSSAHYTVGISKVTNNTITYEPAPTEFPIPVYIATNTESIENYIVGLKLTGKQYVYPESTYKVENFEGKKFNLAFGGYANSSLALDSGTQLQILVNGNPTDKPITTLQRSGTRDINIKTPDNRFLTVTLAFHQTSPGLAFWNPGSFEVGIKSVVINTQLEDLEKSRIEEEDILKTNFNFPIYIKPVEKEAEGLKFTLGIEGFKITPQIVPTSTNGASFAGFANDKGNIYGPSELVLIASNGQKFPLGKLEPSSMSKTYPITLSNGTPLIAGIKFKNQPANDAEKKLGITSVYLVELKEVNITPEEAQKREKEAKLNEEKTYLKNNFPVYFAQKEQDINNIDPQIQASQGEVKFKLQFNGKISRELDPSILPPSNHLDGILVTYANTANGTLNSGSIGILVNGKEISFARDKGPVFKAGTTQKVTIPATPIPYVIEIAYSLITLPDNSPAFFTSIVNAGYDQEAKKAFDEEKSNLSRNVMIFINSIYNDLENPLNKARINNKPENLKNLQTIRSKISDLKNPLTNILAILNSPNVSIDIAASNKTLLGYNQKIGELKKEVTSFLETNKGLNDADDKAKAEEAAKKEAVEQDTEFLKNNIPVYIVKNNMYKVNSVTFRLEFDNKVAPKSSIKKTSNLDGVSLEFAGYTDLTSKIDSATLILYVDNVKHEVTKTIIKDTSQEINILGPDKIPYIVKIDYSLKDNLNIIEPSSEKINPDLPKRAYIISLLPVIENTQAIEAAKKAAEEARHEKTKNALIDSITALLKNIDTSAVKQLPDIKDPALATKKNNIDKQIRALIQNIETLKSKIENNTIDLNEATSELRDHRNKAQSLINEIISLKIENTDITLNRQEIYTSAYEIRRTINDQLKFPGNFTPFNSQISGKQNSILNEIRNLRPPIENILTTFNKADFDLNKAAKILDGTNNVIVTLKTKISDLVNENSKQFIEKEKNDQIRNKNQELVDADIEFLQINTPVYLAINPTLPELDLSRFITRKDSILKSPVNIEGVEVKFIGYAPDGKLANNASLILKMNEGIFNLPAGDLEKNITKIAEISIPGDKPYPIPMIVTYDISFKSIPATTLLSASSEGTNTIDAYIIRLVSVVPNDTAIAAEEKKISDAKAAADAEKARIEAEKAELIREITTLLKNIDISAVQEIAKLKDPFLLPNRTAINGQITTLIQNIKTLQSEIENDKITLDRARTELIRFKNQFETLVADVNILKENDADITLERDNIESRAEGLRRKIDGQLKFPSNFTPIDSKIADLQRSLTNEVDNIRASILDILKTVRTKDFNFKKAIKTLDDADHASDNIKTRINDLVTENQRLTDAKIAADELRNKQQALVDADVKYLQNSSPVYLITRTTPPDVIDFVGFIARKESILKTPVDIDGAEAKFIGYAIGNRLSNNVLLVLKTSEGTFNLPLENLGKNISKVINIDVPSNRPYPIPYIVTYNITHKLVPITTLLSVTSEVTKEIDTYIIELNAVPDDIAIAAKEQEISDRQKAEDAEKARVEAEKRRLISAATTLIESLNTAGTAEIVKLKDPSPTLTSDKDNLNADIYNLVQDIERLKTDVENNGITLTAANTRLGNYQSRAQILLGKVGSLKEDNDNLILKRQNIQSTAYTFRQEINTQLQFPSNFTPFDSRYSGRQSSLINQINELRASIENILNTVNTKKFDFNDAERVLNSAKNDITTLKTKIDALVDENSKQFIEKEKKDEIRNKQQALVDADVKFLQTDTPVYLSINNRIPEELDLSRFITRKESILKNLVNIDGTDAKFIGYAPGGKLANSASLVLKMNGETFNLPTGILGKNVLEGVKIYVSGDKPYKIPYIVTYKVDHKPVPITTLLSASSGVTDKIDTYIITLISVTKDDAEIADEERKIKEVQDAQAAEEARIKEAKDEIIGRATVLLDRINTSATLELEKVKDPDLLDNKNRINAQIISLIQEIQNFKSDVENNKLGLAAARTELERLENSVKPLTDSVDLLKENDTDISNERNDIQSRAYEFRRTIDEQLKFPANFSAFNSEIANDQNTLIKEIGDLKESIKNLVNKVTKAKFDFKGALRTLTNAPNVIKDLKTRIDALIGKNAKLTEDKLRADEIRNKKQELVDTDIKFLQTNTPVYLAINNTLPQELDLSRLIARNDSILKSPVNIDGVDVKFIGYAPDGKLANNASLILKMDGNIFNLPSENLEKNITKITTIYVQGNKPYRIPYIVTYDITHKPVPITDLLTAPSEITKAVDIYIIRLISVVPDDKVIAAEEQKIKEAQDAQAAEEARIKAEKEELIDAATLLLSTINTSAAQEVAKSKDSLLIADRNTLNTQINNLIREVEDIKSKIEKDEMAPDIARSELIRLEKEVNSLIGEVKNLKDKEVDITNQKQTILNKAIALRKQLIDLRLPVDFNPADTTIADQQAALEKDIRNRSLTIDRIFLDINKESFKLNEATKTINETSSAIKSFETRLERLISLNLKRKQEKEAADLIKNKEQAIVDAGVDFIQKNAPVYLATDTTLPYLFLDKFISRKESILKDTINVDGTEARFVGYAPNGNITNNASLVLKTAEGTFNLTPTPETLEKNVSKVTTIQVPGSKPYPIPYIVSYSISHKPLPISTILTTTSTAATEIEAYIITLTSVVPDTAAIKIKEDEIIEEARKQAIIDKEKKRLVNIATRLLRKIDTFATKEVEKIKDPFLAPNKNLIVTEISNLIKNIETLKKDIEDNKIALDEAAIKLTRYEELAQAIISDTDVLRDNNESITKERINISTRAYELRNQVNTQLRFPGTFKAFNATIAGQQNSISNRVDNLRSRLEEILTNFDKGDYKLATGLKTLDDAANEIKFIKTDIDNLVSENSRLTKEQEEIDRIRNENQQAVDKDIRFLQTDTPVYLAISTKLPEIELNKFIERKESVLKSPININGTDAKLVGYAPGGKLANDAALVLRMDEGTFDLTKTPEPLGKNVLKTTIIEVPGNKPYPIPYIVTYFISHKPIPISTLLSATSNITNEIETYIISLVNVVLDTDGIAKEEKKIKDAEIAKEAAMLASRSDMRTRIDLLLGTILTKLEASFKGVTVNSKLEMKLENIKSEITKIKDGLANIRQKIDTFTLPTDFDSNNNIILGFEQKIEDTKKNVDAFTAENDALNEAERLAEEERQRLARETKAREAEIRAQLEFLKEHRPVYVSTAASGNAKLDLRDREGIKGILPLQVNEYRLDGYVTNNQNVYKGDLYVLIDGQAFVIIPEGSKLLPDVSATVGTKTYHVKLKIETRDIALNTALPNSTKAYFVEILQVTVTEQARPKTREELHREAIERVRGKR